VGSFILSASFFRYTFAITTKNMTQWQPQADRDLLQKDYLNAISVYERIIREEPEVVSHYFYLGLLQLLQGQETEAQYTWMSCITDDATLEQIEQWTSDLVKILFTEVERQITIPEYDTAWLICRHIHELDRANLDNLITLVWLSIQLKTLDRDDDILAELIEILKESASIDPLPELNRGCLWDLLTCLAKYPPYPLLVELTEACSPFVQYADNFIYTLITASIELSYFANRNDLAIALLEIAARVSPQVLEVLEHLSGLYQNSGNHVKGLETAKICCEMAERLIDKFFSNALLLRAFLNKGGHWQESLDTFATQEELLSALVAESPIDLPQPVVNRLYTANYFAPYMRDDPRQNRALQNQIAQLCQANTKINLVERMQQFRDRLNSQNCDRSSDRKLKIGYISHCMASHSVGWLARWLLRHHDREKFELYGYFQVYRQYPDALQDWFEHQMDGVYRSRVDGSGECDDMAKRIYEDQIDILVDLDSITLDGTCGVMALKPAPIQITWLGTDASGIPAIDYFIADPYVLPDHAQEYYSEKIWRLPETYIAVDGFEIAVPSLRRDRLDIPADAVVYLSAQRGYKRHIDTMRLQMQIIKSVPNSYFLIKGLGDQESIKSLFVEMAKEEGVNPDCLRFLNLTETEAIHRANLTIADIVLDTYPYNGATTTLETLWMGIPLVTRVGEQFSARNSYGMMVNVGISEGVAWTDAEYVEWGIKLGKDAQLRQDISMKLKASRQTSPLWNGKKFALEMEKAYQQMWQKFCDGE